eukprot:538511_1
MTNRTHNIHKLLIICNYILIQAAYSQKYVYNSNIKTWNDAESYCQSVYNTHLASIHSWSDNADATNACQADQCHIGLNDKANEAQWEWSDGSSVDFGPNFKVGQPDDWTDNGNVPTGEDCVELMTSTAKWNDLHCDSDSRKHAFLCNAVPPSINPTSA